MKRFLLSLIVAGGLALMAAPNAGAVVSQCGTLGSVAGVHYAVSITGSEVFYGPEPASGPVPTPIAGIGAITITENASTGVCTVGGELLYNDNDTVQGPAACTPGGTALAYNPPSTPPTVVPIGGTVPCFDGDSTLVTGTATLNNAYNGVLTLTAHYGTYAGADCINGSGPCGAPTDVALAFNINAGLGDATFAGASQADETQSTAPPVLIIDGRKQGVAAATGIQNTTYGAAPWLGETTSTAGGPGGATVDSTTCPGCGSANSGFNVTNTAASGALAGGSLTYNNNNDWVDTLAVVLPGLDCHYSLARAVSGGGPFSDGTVNVAAIFDQPYTGACGYVNIAAGFALGDVQYGATNTSAFSMVEGQTSFLSATPGTYGAPNSAGVLAESPALSLAPRNPPATLTVVGLAASFPKTYALGYANPSPRDCVMDLTLTDAAGGNLTANCSISQNASALNDQPALAGGLSLTVSGTSPPTYAVDVYPGYVKTDSGAISLFCTAPLTATSPPTIGTITAFAPNCPALNGFTITVKN